MLHTAIIEDPDVRAAVEAFRDSVLQIRISSAKIVGLREGSADRLAEQLVIDGLVADMQSRADRLAITLDDLFRYVNDDLRLNPPPAEHRPTGEHLRGLQAEAIRAAAAEQRAHEALTAVQQRVARTTAARIAAQRACAGFVADMWPR